MYYIKLALLLLFLTSCSSMNNSTITSSSGLPPSQQSDEERDEYRKAITLLNNNKLDAAKEIFLTFKDERPELAGPYANLAIIELQKDNPEKSLNLVKIALTKNPKLSQALNLLAYLEQLNGEIRSAEKHYKEAININNDYAIAHYNIALLYDIYLQDIKSAIQHYERYMELIDNKDKNTKDWLEQLKRNRDKG